MSKGHGTLTVEPELGSFAVALTVFTVQVQLYLLVWSLKGAYKSPRTVRK